jgi:hypothetical protein
MQTENEFRAPEKCELCTGVMLACLLVLLASRALAVDPLPPAIENASLATQQAYLEQLGEESDRLRHQYAQQRYEERQRYCQDVAMEMFHEAEARREELLAQAPMPSGATSGPAPARAGAPALPSRARDLGLLGLAVALVWGFRKRLFRKFYA